MKRFAALAPALLLAACMTYPPPPSAPYRAVGQEPGWSLIIDSREIAFIHMDGTQVRQPTPPVIGGIAGEIYQTPRIGVNIVHGQCQDVMSGQLYRDRVQVTVDGRRFEGCGGDTVAPTAGALAGTNWRVTAVNGRVTPAAGPYFMNFKGNRVGMRFGCNTMGAEYRQAGSTLDLGVVTATRMACGEPAMSFENQAGAILSDPLSAAWTGGNRLTLSNARGRIDLQRMF